MRSETKIGLRAHLQGRAHRILRDVHALWLAARDPGTPWYAKWLALAVVAYAVSPIDLIPDFIPVLGYLDDLLLVPLGVWLAVRLIPREVLAEHRAAAEAAREQPSGRTAAIVIVLFWLACTALAAYWVLA
ncbi:MAG: YkvA family protein [Burkholderiales bacterium]